MPDNEVDILIRFGLDASKARDAVSELRKIKSANDDASASAVKGSEAAGAASQEQSKHVSGLHKAVGLLTHQFGELGRLAHFALTNPISFGVAAVAIGLHKINEKSAELQETLKNLAASSGHSFGDMSGTLRESLLAFIASNVTFKRTQEELQLSISETIKKIDAQKDATLTLLAAQKAVALSTAKNDQEKKSIEDRFSKLEESVKLRSSEAVLAQREKGLAADIAEQKKKQTEAQENLNGVSKESAEVELKNIPKQREDLLKDKAAVDAARKELQDLALSPAGAVTLLKTFGSAQGIKDYGDSLDQRKASVSAKLLGLDQKEERLTRGIAAADADEQLRKKITIERGEVGAMRTRDSADRKAGLMTAFSDAGLGSASGFLPGAGAAAVAIGSGGRASAADAIDYNKLMNLFANNKKAKDDLMRLLFDVFKDGVVTPQEVERLKTLINRNSQRS